MNKDKYPQSLLAMTVTKRREYIMKKGSILPINKLSKSRQLWLFDNHPFFTGICDNCGYDYGNYKVLDIDEKSSHWNCPECEISYK